jgi:aryl-alcohol dehydrogenase-like predicted oxidoreductase
VEGELIPMAQALGLGVTPWSPLRSGVLSGKYSRDYMKAESTGRADWVARNANEHTFKVLDVLAGVARQRDTTPARAAIAWVLSRPGVTSPILGARTEAQLDDNLEAIDVKLAPEDIAALDMVTKPALNFPTAFLGAAVPASYPGITVNGRDFQVHSRSEQMESH